MSFKMHTSDINEARGWKTMTIGLKGSRNPSPDVRPPPLYRPLAEIQCTPSTHEIRSPLYRGQNSFSPLVATIERFHRTVIRSAQEQAQMFLFLSIFVEPMADSAERTCEQTKIESEEEHVQMAHLVQSDMEP